MFVDAAAAVAACSCLSMMCFLMGGITNWKMICFVRCDWTGVQERSSVRLLEGWKEFLAWSFMACEARLIDAKESVCAREQQR